VLSFHSAQALCMSACSCSLQKLHFPQKVQVHEIG
jgi:hypothetical protein